MKTFTAAILIAALSVLTPMTAQARYSETKMIDYAIMIGRGIACGLDVDYPVHAVNNWIRRNLSARQAGSATKIAAVTMYAAAAQQRSGGTADTCSSIRRAFPKISWP